MKLTTRTQLTVDTGIHAEMVIFSASASVGVQCKPVDAMSVEKRLAVVLIGY
jgi:hypothetical protein